MPALAPAFATAVTSHDQELIDALIRSLTRRDALPDRERAALAEAVGDVRVHPQGDTLIRAHTLIDRSTLLLQGMLGRTFHLADGQQQIVALHVPGDFVDLHSLLLKRLDHDIVALTDVRVATFPHAGLRRISEREPHLTRMLWLLTVIDGAIHREWTARRDHSAAVRVAQLLCEIHCKLAVVGLATPEGFALDLTQGDIGRMTGLTTVHVNRTMRRLREAGLAIVRGGYASIPEMTKLRAFAQFDPTYLYLDAMPR